jgi:hypothetical protein
MACAEVDDECRYRRVRVLFLVTLVLVAHYQSTIPIFR